MLNDLSKIFDVHYIRCNSLSSLLCPVGLSRLHYTSERLSPSLWSFLVEVAGLTVLGPDRVRHGGTQTYSRERSKRHDVSQDKI